MSEVFRKALSFVEEQRKKGVPDVVIQEKLPQFKEGGFTVNRYVPSNPILLGMEAPNIKFEINSDNVKLVEKFAKRRGLTVKTVEEGIQLVNENGEVVGLIKQNMFLASSPRLFEDIGKVLYRISPDLKAELELMDGWEAAVARLLADKRLLDRLFIALFFFFSPVLWAAIALFITPSLFFPREILIAIGVVGAALAVYVLKIYYRENFSE